MQKIVPGAIHDEKFKIFGLSDKVAFSKKEYQKLIEKYSDIDDIYAKWLEYKKLKKEKIHISQLEEEKNKLRKMILDKKKEKQKKEEALEQVIQYINQTKDSEYHTQFDIQKQELEQQIGLIDKEIEKQNNRIKEIDQFIQNINERLDFLKKECSKQLSRIGGFLPQED